MAKLSDRELLSIVDAEFESAMGSSGGEISTERAKAWDYYLSKELGNEIEGQSRIVTSDVSDVVDGIMPSLLRIFTTAENLVNFDAVGQEDEDQAQQESDYVNYVFFKQNPAFLILFYWFFDALVQKNGIVKAWWDDSEVVTTEAYQGLSQPELLELLNDEELEPVERSERIAETVDPATGELVQDTVHDVSFRRITKKGRARVDNVPPEEYRISSDSRSVDPSSARMVGHERDVTRSELLEMGFDKEIVDDLPSTNSDVHDSSETIARYNKTDDTQGGPHDRSQDNITLREAYIRVDYDGDGRSELRQVFTAGHQVLSNEPADRQPFHVITPHPLPHKHFGRATSEKVMDIQKVNTTLLRQMLDNLYHTNNPGHAVWEQGIGENTLDDLMTTRVGRVARFNRPVNESYQPMSVPFTAAQTFPMMEWFDKTKRDRTGISADSEGLSPEALKNIQTSVLAQSQDISKMKVEAIARIFAETGIKSLMLHIHELLMKHQQKEQVVKLRNQWIPVDPRSWRTRMDMTVNIGLGIGTREQNLLHLNAIWEKQTQGLQMGWQGITGENLFNTASEIVKNANLKQPEMFFSQGDVQGQTDEQQQLAEQQMQIQARQQELDAQEQHLKLQKERLNHQRETEKMALDHQHKLAELELKQNEQQDKLMVEMEKIANKLTELELNNNQDIPGSRV